MLSIELKKLKLKQELVSIERNCHDLELTGFIGDITDELVTMLLVDDEGVYSGFTVFNPDQIEEVYWGNREHKAIAALARQYKEIDIPKVKSTSFFASILEFNERFSSVCIHEFHEEESFLIAEIDSYDAEWIKLNTFGTRKSLSRMHKMIQKSAISRIVVDSPYQNGIVHLHEQSL